ncbi:alpha/beta fold hydrolase [Kitasatospora sp. NBC_01302]|uniref:alpha/beta fold hydrolase n=1 Tax=Kitasatospora sp. NBC_01302 TaxID=2903575 RepID=UPI002E101029|nr:alpha/beta hydrolase [Kitasatospora sp. NBC_01302]
MTAAVLAFEEEGSGERLVCMPGGPGFPPDYLRSLRELSGSRTVTLLHPRGTGRSPAPADRAAYRIDDYVADLELTRRHLGLERLDLLGHAHGGIVAARYAAAHPERVNALVLLNTPAYGGGRAEQRAAEFFASREGEPGVAAALAALDEPDGDAYSSPRELGRRIAEILPLWLARPETAGADWAALSRTLTVNPDAALFFDQQVFPRLDVTWAAAAIACPTLVLTGDRDPYAGPEHADELAAVIPGARVRVLPGAGHMSQVDAPGPVRRAVLDFLENLDGTAERTQP